MTAGKAHLGALTTGATGAGLISYLLPLIPGYSGMPMDVQVGIAGAVSAIVGWLVIYHTPNTPTVP